MGRQPTNVNLQGQPSSALRVLAVGVCVSIRVDMPVIKAMKIIKKVLTNHLPSAFQVVKELSCIQLATTVVKIESTAKVMISQSNSFPVMPWNEYVGDGHWQGFIWGRGLQHVLGHH